MTSEDRQFWRAVADQFGRRPEPHAPPFAPSSEPVTAVVFSAPRAVVVTVRISGDGGARIDDGSSGIFELGDRSDHAVKAMARNAGRFFSQRKITNIYVRSGAVTGRYPPHALSLKMETIFQLMDDLRVTFVNTQCVAAWVRREVPEIPLALDQHLSARWSAVQTSALEAAIFTAWNRNSSQYFSDGSAANG